METRLQLIEENFESQQSGKSDLLIRIGEGNISYAIVDKGREQLKALVEYKAGISDLGAIIQSDRHLSYFFRKIKISATTFKFTFIPRDVFSDSELKNYSRFISTGAAAEVLVNDIRPFRIKNITSFDADIRQNILTRFRQPALFNQATPFIEGAFRVYHQPAVHLFINVHSETLELAVLKEGNLQFYNVFECSSADEFNYFLLLTIKQLDLPEDTSVTLAGKTDAIDAYYERVDKYFKTISFANPGVFIQHSETFDQVNLHQYFSLLSLNLCE